MNEEGQSSLLPNSSFGDPDFSAKSVRWLLTSEGESALSQILASNEPIQFQQANALHRRFGEDRARILLEQHALRSKIAKKFKDTQNWIWTAKLLEQASDETVSEYTANQFPAETQVVDVCCGGGADSIALARKGALEGSYDVSELACALATANLQLHGFEPNVVQMDVTKGSITKGSQATDLFCNIDPDRRPMTGQRTTLLDFVEPNVAYLERAIQTHPGGSIKLAPATDAEALSTASIAREWISHRNSLRQQRIWWGIQSAPGDKYRPQVKIATRLLSTVEGGCQEVHFSRTTSEIAQDFEDVVFTDEFSAFVADPDPSIRAAGLNASFALHCNAHIVGGQHGYITGDKPFAFPGMRVFQILECSSIDLKRLRKLCRNHDVGKLTIKKRGVQFDADKLLKHLPASGSNSAWLFMVRTNKRRLAALALEV